MLSINDYLLQEKRKIMNVSVIIVLFTFFIVLSLIIFNHKLRIYDYISYNAVVKSDKEIIIPYDINNLESITKSKNLLIDNKSYKYKVKEINSNNIVIILNKKQDFLITNNIFMIKIITKDKGVFSYICDMIGGML